MDPIILVFVVIGACLIAYLVTKQRAKATTGMAGVFSAMGKVDEETKQAIKRDQEAVEADINARYPDHTNS